jgi:hypothetical protein
MSFKITKDDFTIEVTTEEELNMVIRALTTKKKVVSLNPKDFVVDYDTLIAIYRSIMPDTKAYDLIELLKKQSNPLTKYELIEQLGLDNAQALGGIFSGLTKYAKKYGLTSDELVKWEFKNNTSTYRLTDSMVKALEEMNDQSND